MPAVAQSVSGDPPACIGMSGVGYPDMVLLGLSVVALLCLTLPSFAWMVSIVAHRVFLYIHVEFDPLLSRRSPVCQSGTITLWCRMWIVF